MNCTQKVPAKRHVNAASEEERGRFRKKVQRLLHKALEEERTVLIQDESIVMVDPTFGKKLWTEVGVRPTLLTNGSRQKTVVYGALTHDGRQLCMQDDKFNQYGFLKHIKAIHEKFGKVLIFVDKAPQHRSKIVTDYVDDSGGDIKLCFLPKASPQLSAIEEFWRQLKRELVVSRYHPSKAALKDEITKYLKKTRSTLDIVKYLLRLDR